jgi:hypothetical protein
MDSYQQPVTSVNRSRKWVENTQRKEILVILISCLDNGGHYTDPATDQKVVDSISAGRARKPLKLLSSGGFSFFPDVLESARCS